MRTNRFTTLFLSGLSILIFTVAFTFNSFAQDYVTTGNAVSTGGDCFRLTQALNSQAGAVWRQTKVNLENDFTVNANIYLGSNDGGADGIAFVLQPICSGLGGLGGGIGYFGINPSLAIEFDTWQNGDRNDPAADHISLQKNGVINHGVAENLSGPYIQANMENNVWKSITIDWDAGSQTLTLVYLGNTIFTYTDDIVNNIFGGNTAVFWGFTAATGAANNLQQVCITSVVSTDAPSYTAMNATCPNGSDGSIDLEITGGVGPFGYNWAGSPTGDGTSSISGLTAGTYTVSVSDANGCVSVYSIPVGADPDTEAPEITCPDNIEVDNDAGACGAVVFYDLPTVTDNCGLIPTAVAGYTFKGSFGGSNYFLADVASTPVVARSNAIAAGGHLAVITSGAENAFVAAAANNGEAWIGLNDVYFEGQYTWETGEPYGFTQWAGGEPNNSGNEDFTETNRFGIGNWNDMPAWPTWPRGIAEFDGKAVLVTGAGSGSFFPIGTTPMEFTATDLSGNSSSCSFSITVNDVESPDVRCPEDIVVDNDPGDCSAVVMYDDAGYGDNCEGTTLAYSHASGSTFDVGTTTITVTATDASGNETTCEFDVTVNDAEAPTAICQDISVNPGANGNYNIDANAVDDGSTDNCGIASISVNPSVIPCFHDATEQTVTLTVTDIHGNSSTCTSTVTLLGDSDCDGVGDFCDLCPGGNDQIDNNGDGYPDCDVFPGSNFLLPEWKCSNNNNNVKVYICHFPNGNPANHTTLCVSVNAVAAHLAHGDYIGPCDNASCDGNRPSTLRGDETIQEEPDYFVFPNPASDQIMIHMEGVEEAKGRVVILDQLGRTVQVENEVLLGHFTSNLNIETLGSGLYTVKIEIEGLKLEMKRFTVIK